MTLLLSTGEASGDAYGAALVTALRECGFDGAVVAAGGVKISATGAEMLADTRGWGSIGVLESLRGVPRVAAGYFAVKRALADREPGVFVPIDYGWANVRLARFAKEKGWKVIYFIPPGSWRRATRPRELPRVTDAIVCPFPWNVEPLNAAGANAHFFGHPLKSLLTGLPEVERRGVAVLPGSRRQEVFANLPPIAEGLRGIADGVNFGVAPGFDEQVLSARWAELSELPTEFYDGAAKALLASEVGVICSGTATLEAALCRCPCVVVYSAGRILEMEARLTAKGVTRFVALPNILLDRSVVPELLAGEANPARIASEVGQLLDEPQAVEQVAAFEEIDRMLGPSDAIESAARLIFQYLA